MVREKMNAKKYTKVISAKACLIKAAKEGNQAAVRAVDDFLRKVEKPEAKITLTLNDTELNKLGMLLIFAKARLKEINGVDGIDEDKRAEHLSFCNYFSGLLESKK